MAYKGRFTLFLGKRAFCRPQEKYVSVKSDALRTCRRHDADLPADRAADGVPPGSPWSLLVRESRGIGHPAFFETHTRLQKSAQSLGKPAKSVDGFCLSSIGFPSSVHRSRSRTNLVSEIKVSRLFRDIPSCVLWSRIPQRPLYSCLLYTSQCGLPSPLDTDCVDMGALCSWS